MNSENTFSSIPHELRSMPWIQQFVKLLQEQTQRVASLKDCLEKLWQSEVMP